MGKCVEILIDAASRVVDQLQSVLLDSRADQMMFAGDLLEADRGKHDLVGDPQTTIDRHIALADDILDGGDGLGEHRVEESWNPVPTPGVEPGKDVSIDSDLAPWPNESDARTWFGGASIGVCWVCHCLR